jgi:hypothetical protein
MSLTQREQQLRVIARERIAGGELPCEPASRMWGGYGTGQLCSLCRDPIQPDQIEYEVERMAAGRDNLLFHLVCQSVWQLECASHDQSKSRA